jgi:tripartite-type tricarboxylate transporter receptor subunit TctC
VMALLQGDVQFACVPAVAVMPQVKAGKLRPLAVSTAKRSVLTPEIPTLKEAGLPDVENVAWMAVMAPSTTPNDVVERFNRAINAVLQQPDVKERMAAAFMEPVGGTPAELQAFMRRERDVMTPVIKRSGATID